jgi:DNA polymerase-1
MLRQSSIFNSDVEYRSTTDKWQIPTELPDLFHIDTIALDTETQGLHFRDSKVIGISIAYREENDIKSYYFPFNHAAGNMDPDRIREWAKNELAYKKIYFCNAKFDIHQLRNWSLDLEEIQVEPDDIQFRAALLDDSRYVKVNLDTLAKKYTGEGKLELSERDKRNMAALPSWQVGPYAERDAIATLQVAEVTQPLLEEENLINVLKVENDIIYPVCEIERNGCRIDLEKLDYLIGKAGKDYSELIVELSQMVGFAVNPFAATSMERLFKHLRLPIPKEKRKKKDGTEHMVSSFTEENLIAANNPVVDKAMRARQVGGLQNRYLRPFKENLSSDNHLYFSLHQTKSDKHGTVSGRFSASGGADDESGYSFNVQQILKPGDEEEDPLELALQTQYQIRSMFIPDSGYDFFACDAKQIEYRLFADFAKAKAIVDRYNSDANANYHKIVWAIVKQFGSVIDYSQIKNVNFARAFGAQAEKISRMTGLPLKETKDFLALYDRVMPEQKEYMDATAREAEQVGYVTTLLGRRARFKPGGEALHKAVNRRVQGSAADIFKLKLARLYRERKTLGIYKMRQPVHDEQCGDKDKDPKYTKLLQECFDVQEFQLSLPILWELGTGRNWKECK